MESCSPIDTLEETLKDVPDIVFVYSEDDRYLFINRARLKFLGPDAARRHRTSTGATSATRRRSWSRCWTAVGEVFATGEVGVLPHPNVSRAWLPEPRHLAHPAQERQPRASSACWRSARDVTRYMSCL